MDFVMRTGFNNVLSDTINPELRQRITNILVYFMEKSVVLGAKYASAAGRDTMTSMDLMYALQYQAHHFQENVSEEENLEQKLDQIQIDIEEEDSEEEDSEEENSEEEVFTRYEGDDSLMNEMNRCHDHWDSWNPTDTIQQMVKSAVDQIYIHNEGLPI